MRGRDLERLFDTALRRVRDLSSGDVVQFDLAGEVNMDHNAIIRDMFKVHYGPGIGDRMMMVAMSRGLLDRAKFATDSEQIEMEIQSVFDELDGEDI